MKTRFAPSPTGDLHIGGVRTALFAWLAAKSQGGEFYLRIEDTDRGRYVANSVDQIQQSLSWLGIEWDNEIMFQSSRLDTYKQFAQKLIDKNLAYGDPYTPKEVDEFRAQAKAEKRAFLYRDHRPENPPKYDGSTALRFKVPEIKRYTWQDIVRGELSAGEEALDDIILLKAADENGDIYPTYNFAHIIDDHEMEITHVIRGEEFIASMPKYLSLYDALDISVPQFATVPPILAKEGGKKLSKRDGARSSLEYKDAGYLPQAVNNFLAALGWNDGTDQEVFTTTELLEKFSLDRIQKSPARYDESKLNWLNWQHVKKMIKNDVNALSKYLSSRSVEFNESNLAEVASLVATKARDTDNFIEQLKIFYSEVSVSISDIDLEKIDPSLDESSAKELLQQLHNLLNASEFNAQSLEDNLRKFIADNSLQPRLVLMLLRDKITGQKVSPSLFDTMALLGKTETLRRLK